MNGLRPIPVPGSVLWRELRFRCLPWLVFASVVIAAGFCWREFVLSVTAPLSNPAISQKNLPREQVHPPVVSISYTSPAANGKFLSGPTIKPKPGSEERSRAN